MVKFLHSMALGGGELYAKFVYFNTDDSPTTSDPWAAPLRFLSPVNFASRLVGANEDFIRSSRMVSRLPSNENSLDDLTHLGCPYVLRDCRYRTKVASELFQSTS